MEAAFLQILISLISAAAVGGAVYGGIRADLRNLREHHERNSRAIGKAHERIDQILARD